jgi:hypothetical protein
MNLTDAYTENALIEFEWLCKDASRFLLKTIVKLSRLEFNFQNRYWNRSFFGTDTDSQSRNGIVHVIIIS